jgi:hypothetical protein
MIPLARIAVWGLSLGAAILIVLILGGSEDVQAKVGEASLLFVLFSINSLGGFLLIKRRPELTLLGAPAIGLSIAAYFVILDSIFSHGLISTSESETGSSGEAVWLLVVITILTSQASMLLAFRRDEDSPLVNLALSVGLIALALLTALAILAAAGTNVGSKVYAVLAVLYLLGALLPPCLRWAEVEES